MARTFLLHHLMIEGQRRAKRNKGSQTLALQNAALQRHINHSFSTPHGTTFFDFISSYFPTPFPTGISTFSFIQETHSNCGKGREVCLKGHISSWATGSQVISCLLKKMGIITPEPSMDCVLFVVGLIQNIKNPVHINNFHLFFGLIYFSFHTSIYCMLSAFCPYPAPSFSSPSTFHASPTVEGHGQRHGQRKKSPTEARKTSSSSNID